MPLPDIVKRAADCARGNSVRVTGPRGSYHVLSAEENDAEPDPAAETAVKLAELDAQILATVGVVAAIAANVNEMAKRVEDALLSIKGVAETTASSQSAVARSAEQIATALSQPIVPVYDKRGKLIAAQRTKTL